MRIDKKLLAIGGLLIAIITLPIIVLFQQQQTQTSSEAQQTTTLFFTPDTTQNPIQKAPQDNFAFDIMINPGQNLVTLVKIDLSFDPTKIGYDGTSAFAPNTAAFPEIVEGPIYGANKFTVTVSIGNDPTRSVGTTTKIGTINLKALAATGGTPTQISFTNLSQVLSSASTDQASENVLAGTSPARISINSAVSQCTLPANTRVGRVFETTLSGNQEVPPNSSPALGKARVVVPPSSSVVYVTYCYNGLTSANNGTHIHLPAPPGQTAPPILNLPSSVDTTFSYTDHIASVVPAWITDLENGLWYINVHSNDFTNGEIRDQFAEVIGGGITPTLTPTAVPTNTPTLTPTRTPTLTPTRTPTPIPPTPTRTPTPTSLPTNTPIPTSTPIPQGVSVSFTAFLHGIGSSGDSKNPTDSTLSNKTPLHPSRQVVVEVFNAQEVKIAEASGTITYNTAAGNFQGGVDFGTSLPGGTYLVKVKTDQYLKKQFTGIQTLVAGPQANPLPTVSLVSGDVNDDNALDIKDYNLILGCYSDLLPAKACNAQLKLQTDITDDGNVNQSDYNLFLREMSVQSGD